MFGLYTFMDWHGNFRTMRASTIHKKVGEASRQSNYNWIASATDLINVCNKKGFPIEYSIEIKSTILNCYATLITCEDDTTRRKKTDLKAVYYAYNSLYGIINEKAINARINFLNGFLSKICWNPWQFLIYRGESFLKVCNEWQNSKLKELINLDYINFDEMETLLEEDLAKTIKEAKEAGLFKEDEKIEEEIQKRRNKEIVNYCLGSYDKTKTKVLKP